jgi:hypothetical protein
MGSLFDVHARGGWRLCVIVARQDHTSQKWTGNSAERLPVCLYAGARARCSARCVTGLAVVSGCVTLTVTLTLCLCRDSCV